jgi:hypothetical protein
MGLRKALMRVHLMAPMTAPMKALMRALRMAPMTAPEDD